MGGSSLSGQGNNPHIINQSLKPKMIMNNNSQANRFGQGSSHQQTFQQHQGHNGDNVQISNPGDRSNMRPHSSKIVKKKPTSSSSGNMVA